MKTSKIHPVRLCLLLILSYWIASFGSGFIFMKEIKLTHGLVAQVNDADFELLNSKKWFANKIGKTYYACRSVKIPKSRKSNTIYMHRVIMDISNPNVYVDHKDHNGINNQRENLRVCLHHQNLTNLKKRKNTSSPYFGVCHYPNLKQPNRYAAYISAKGKRYPLGYYVTEKEAALAYNRKAIELHGEFAKQNNVS